MSTQDPTPPPDRGRKTRRSVQDGSFRGRILSRLRNYLLAGALVTLPIALTIYVAWVVVTWVDLRVMRFVPMEYRPDAYLPFPIPGLGLILGLAALIVIGALTANLVGRSIVRQSERLLNRMPVIRGIYGTFKQVFETVLSQQSNAFREVVLIEYPRRGLWALGFLTGETVGEVQNVTRERVLNVFLPTTPNPTSGFLLFVPAEDVIVLDMPVEWGIKMVVSGGIVTPPDTRPLHQQQAPRTSAKTYEKEDILRERENRLRPPARQVEPEDESL